MSDVVLFSKYFDMPSRPKFRQPNKSRFSPKAKAYQGWMNEVRLQLRPTLHFAPTAQDGCVQLRVTLYGLRGRTDVENHLGGIADALSGSLFTDDNYTRVCGVSAHHRAPHGSPGFLVELLACEGHEDDRDPVVATREFTLLPGLTVKNRRKIGVHRLID